MSEKTAQAPPRLSIEQLGSIVACPSCGAEIAPVAGADVLCDSCVTSYPSLPHGWDLTPPREVLTSELWRVWQQLQENGAVAYEQDPERNLGVGERPDCLAFSRFCALDGLVLDVGCGPQGWPAYFSEHKRGTRFVGVDPMVGEGPADYVQLRALGEHLPFREAVFDQVLFATTLDHLVDPVRALKEARRVLSPRGSVNIWLGHKAPGAPPPPETPPWCERMSTPEGAQDLFHIERLDPAGSERLFAKAGMTVTRHEAHPVDEFRTHHFYRLR